MSRMLLHTAMASSSLLCRSRGCAIAAFASLWSRGFSSGGGGGGELGFGRASDRYREGAEAVQRWPYASKLSSRGVVRFRGPDTFRFLQGLVSNDLRRLEQEPPPSEVAMPTLNRPSALCPPVYAALLSPQGRFLFDLVFYRPPRHSHILDRTGSAPASSIEDLDDDASAAAAASASSASASSASASASAAAAPPSLLLCDFDASVADELFNHLKKHKLRAEVEVEDVSKEFTAWQRYGGPLISDTPNNEDPEVGSVGWGADIDRASQASNEGNNEGCSWFRDPRCPALGFRGIFPSSTLPPSVDANKETDEVYFRQLRLSLGIAEGSKEIQKDKANPLEYNLAWLNAISFEKGCYVGQELMARTHHRGVIRKRLMPFTFVSEAGEELQEAVEQGAAAEIIDKEGEKKVGDVTTVLGSKGLGVIRLEAAQKDASKLVVKDASGVHVRLHIPKWWPQNWCPEELK